MALLLKKSPIARAQVVVATILVLQQMVDLDPMPNGLVAGGARLREIKPDCPASCMPAMADVPLSMLLVWGLSKRIYGAAPRPGALGRITTTSVPSRPRSQHKHHQSHDHVHNHARPHTLSWRDPFSVL